MNVVVLIMYNVEMVSALLFINYLAMRAIPFKYHMNDTPD